MTILSAALSDEFARIVVPLWQALRKAARRYAKANGPRADACLHILYHAARRFILTVRDWEIFSPSEWEIDELVCDDDDVRLVDAACVATDQCPHDEDGLNAVLSGLVDAAVRIRR